MRLQSLDVYQLVVGSHNPDVCEGRFLLLQTVYICERCRAIIGDNIDVFADLLGSSNFGWLAD